jgi:L-cystine uptake protein TcyP (sodium:dicarboxylate symporter family)
VEFMSLALTLNLLVIVALVVGLVKLRLMGLSLSRRVLVSLIAGAVLGLALQAIYIDSPDVITATLGWSNVLGAGYVSLLKMIIMPLILVSMIAAVVRMEAVAALGKIGGLVVGMLIFTTIIAALIGIMVTNMFGLTAEGLTEGARELARAEVLVVRQTTVADMGLAQIVLSFIPQNIFSDLTGARPTSIIAVVIFGILTGIAGLHLKHDHPEQGAAFSSFVETAQAVVLRLVRMVIGLTPYGVLALMLKVTASSSGDDILNLLGFIIASYLAIFLMFCVHAFLIFLAGKSPADYFKRVWPVLTFAFTSRSSAATIPLNVETQIRELNVASPIANLSATFGTTIGQNGCAGIYPAMLAVMVAPTMGVNPLDPIFILTLVGVVAISSFGVAGVGGGATFAALIVLPAMGFPVALVALLISIEPLIDMARTALNVSGSMTTGLVTSRLLGMPERDESLTEGASP